MIGLSNILFISDLLTFGIGFGLILTQPGDILLSTIGKILVILGVFVNICFILLMAGARHGIKL